MDDNALIAEDPTHWMFSGTADLSDPAQFGKPQMNALAEHEQKNALASRSLWDRATDLSDLWDGAKRLYNTTGKDFYGLTPPGLMQEAWHAATNPAQVDMPKAEDHSLGAEWQRAKGLYSTAGPAMMPLFGMFGGPKAKTADKAAFAEAQAMTEAGHEPKAVWDKTGWFQGADGKWKFEIPDHESHLLTDLNSGGGRTLPIDGQFSHDAMFGAYPGLKNSRLGIAQSERPGGLYMPPEANDPFHILKAQGPDRGTVRSIALHEGQHGIQHIENFGQGGTSSEFGLTHLPTKERAHELFSQWKAKGANLSDEDLMHNAIMQARHESYKRTAGEVEARNVQTRMNMTPEERRATPPWETEDVPRNQQIVRFGNNGVSESRPVHPTETPEFKDWFGDSKVIDAEGKPLVAYHGTRNSFDAFDLNKIAKNGEGDVAIFHSSEPELASSYAYPKGSMSNPKGLEYFKGANVIPSYLSIKNPKKISVDDWLSRGQNATLIEQAKREGHDGIIFTYTNPGYIKKYGKNLQEFVSFKPEQVKSSIGNRGTFDPKDPRIAYGVGGAGLLGLGLNGYQDQEHGTK